MIVRPVIQAVGAVSLAVIAFIADLTAEEHRTKAMAMVGGSIAVAIVGAFAIRAVGFVLWVVPDAPKPVHVRALFHEGCTTSSCCA